MKLLRSYLLDKLKAGHKIAIFIKLLPLSKICLGMSIGIFIASFSYLVVLLLALILLLFGRRSLLPLCLGAVLGLGIYVSWFGISGASYLDKISSQPQELDCIVEQLASRGAFNQIAIARCDSLSFLTQTIIPSYPVIKVGDELKLTGILELAEKKYDHGYAEYLNSQDIFYIISSNAIEVIKTNMTFSHYFAELRDDLQTLISKNLNDTQTALLAGMLIGTKSELPQDLKSELSLTGLSHIVSVSGYNVMLVILGCFALAGVVPKRLTHFLAGIGLIFLLLLVGSSNLPALRAVIMGFVILVGLARGRRGSIWLSLLYAITLTLASYPLTWKSVSWQLSVLAILGLLVFQPIWQRVLNFLPHWARSILSASFAITIATAPIIFSTFGQVSLISPLANLIVLPLVPVISLLGIAAVVSTMIAHGLIVPLWLGLQALIDVMLKVISVLAQLPVVATSDPVIAAVLVLLLATATLAADFVHFRQQRFLSLNYVEV